MAQTSAPRPPRAGGGDAAPGSPIVPVDWPTRLLGVALVLALSAVQIWDPPLIEAARLRVFDQLQRWQPRAVPAESPVVIVDIDNLSLAEIGQWPWPRSVFAQMITKLGELGAKAIVFDVLFAEADRLSPPLYAQFLEPVDPRVAAILRTLPGNEETMAAAIERFPVVLGEAGIGGTSRRLAGGVDPPARIVWLGDGARDALPAFPQGVTALPTLAAPARGIGLVTVVPEVDGVVRRTPSLARVGERVLPSLFIEAVRVGAGDPSLIVHGDRDAIRAVTVAGRSIATDPDGRLWIHFSLRRDELYLSAVDVLNGQVPAERVAGRIVLVGSSAASLGDVKVTPVTGNTPGVEVQAQLVETILAGEVLRRPPAAVGGERAVVLLAGLLLAWFGGRLPAGWFPPLLAAALLVGAAITWYAYAARLVLVDAAYPAFAIAVLLFWLAMAKYIREETHRRNLRHAFGHYLSPVMVDRLVASPSTLALEGDRKPLTVLFSDIRGFTTLTETHAQAPERLTALLNRYFTAMTAVILAHDGTIDKYIGDAVMAFWNAPLDDPEHPRHACLAALGMMQRLDLLNQELIEEHAASDLPFQPLRIGVGVETGLCFVGNLGSAQRFNYSVIGDAVNVAARLEASTKTYGLPIVVGERVRNACLDLAFLEVDQAQLRGRTEISRVYALLGPAELAADGRWPELAAGQAALLQAVRNGATAEADGLLDRCRELAASLGVGPSYAAFAAMIEARLHGGAGSVVPIPRPGAGPRGHAGLPADRPTVPRLP